MISLTSNVVHFLLRWNIFFRDVYSSTRMISMVIDNTLPTIKHNLLTYDTILQALSCFSQQYQASKTIEMERKHYSILNKLFLLLSALLLR